VGSGRVLVSASYPPLEGAFCARLGALSGDAPPGALWVLVPTNLLGLHLRRQAAERLGAVMGPEFVTLPDAARRLALPRLAAEGMRPVPPGAEELVVGELIRREPDDSYFAAFRRFPNGALAVKRAIELAANCLWSPEALRRTAEGGGFGEEAARKRMSDLARIWAGLREWKRANRLFSADDLIVAAGTEGVEPAAGPEALLIYGFYDLNPAQERLVGRLIRLARRAEAFTLWDERDGQAAPGFEYAERTVRWLVRALGAKGVQSVSREGADSDLARLTGGVFRRGPRRQPDGSVRVLSCPGETAEAAEAAREALRALGERPGGSVGILARDGSQVAGLLDACLRRAGLGAYMAEGLPLSGTLPGRLAMALLELAGSGAERASVLDVLALADVRWPAGLSATALDRLSREAGVLRGRSQWVERLRGRAERLTLDAQRAEDDIGRERLVRDAELCRTAAGFLDEFLVELEGLCSAGSWAELASRLGALVERHCPQDAEGAAQVIEAISGLGRLDVAGVKPGAERARWVLGRRLSETNLRREPYGRSAVSFSGIMRVRGVTFDTVIVPGLVEKGFPRHIPESSLLTDADREALNRAADALGCGELPLQSRRPTEERYLFRIALGSARRAVVLTYSRFEEGSDRPLVPSRFLRAVREALGWDGGEEFRVPLSAAARVAMEPELALDVAEYDAAVFAGGPGGGLRVAYMERVSEDFRSAHRMSRSRWGRGTFGPYDGKLRAEDVLAVLRDRHGRFGVPVSPTRLETYARCPFEYFLEHVLGVMELEAPQEQFELDPLQRGLLVHELLGEVYRAHMRGKAFGRISDEDVEAALEGAARVLERLGQGYLADRPATWEAERERALAELRALLLHERDAHGEAAPEEFELEFGAGGSRAYELSLGPGWPLAFRGRIDRLDRLPGGGIEVVDYKTGGGGGLRPHCLRGGRQLQLPVYLLAAAGMAGARSGRGLYVLVSEPKDLEQFTLEELQQRLEELRRALRLIGEGIASGNFVPLPAQDRDGIEYCQKWCRYGVVCGAARQDLAEMKRADPGLVGLRELRAIP